LIKLRGKYLTASLLTATISVVAMGAVFSYNLSMPESTKTLSIPTDINEDYKMELSPPAVTKIRNLKDVKTPIEGYLDDKIVLFYSPDVPDSKTLNGITLYEPDSGNKNLIYSENKIMQSSATFGMFSISQDKTKIITYDKHSCKSGQPFGIYAYDINKESSIKVADISKEFTVYKYITLGKGEKMSYTAYDGSGWSVDSESVIYCIKKEDENAFDFFIYNIKTDSTMKYTLIDSKFNFITISMPKLSADRRYIYFSGHCNSSPLVDSLYRIDLTNKEKKAEWLTDHANYYYLSTDGRKIVYTDSRINSPKRNIYTFDTLTKEEKVIIENPYCLFDISADGSKIVYTVKNENSIDVKMAYLENDKITNNTTLYRTGLTESIGMAFWNGDGSKIVVESDYGNNFIIDLEYD